MPDLRRLRNSVFDCFWPTLERSPEPKPTELPIVKLTSEVALEVRSRLEAAVEADVDRMRSIDAKLMAVCSVAPICATLLVAIVSFLTTQRPGTFTTSSVLAVVALASFVIIQFVRALLAAIQGLQRRGFLVPTSSSLWAQIEGESVDTYTLRACDDLAERLHQNRETTNEKVSYMAVAHRAYLNAVVGMLLAVIVLSAIILSDYAST